MLRVRTWASVCCLALCGAGPASRPVTAVAAVKVDDSGRPDAGFLKDHEAFLRDGADGHPIDLVLLGDSITAGWFWGHDRDVYDAHFAKYHPANFGIGGDRTEHVLWRIDNGELDRVRPRVLVLLVGTNNIGSPTDEITAGVTAVVDAVHAKLPKTKVLLLAIFPRGKTLADPNVVWMRDKIRAVNDSLAKLDDGAGTRFLDVGGKFLSPDGSISPDVMTDALHPSQKGYGIWADAMQPLLDEMMKP
jgi:lysophospholipase L1-like esterase